MGLVEGPAREIVGLAAGEAAPGILNGRLYSARVSTARPAEGYTAETCRTIREPYPCRVASHSVAEVRAATAVNERITGVFAVR